MNKFAPFWKFILVLWLAFALRLWGLGGQSLWYDEGYSVYLGAHLPLDQALDLTVRDIVPPLYYLLLRVWLPFTGTSEFALRFLSVLLGMMAVALIARLSRLLSKSSIAPQVEGGEEWAGLLGGALGAIAPVLIWLSQDARMYGPLVTWSLLATWGLLRATAATASRRTRRRGWKLFVGAGLAALYTHTISAFWLIGQVAFGLLAVLQQRRHRERVCEVSVALGLMAAGYLPWIIVALVSYQTNAGYWPGYLPPAHLWRTAWETFIGGQHLSPIWTSSATVWIGTGALFSWAVLLIRRPRFALYLFCYLVIPLLAMGIAFRHTPKLAPRYPTPMAPAIFLLLTAAAGISRRGSRLVRYPSLAVLFGVALISLRADLNLLLNPSYAKSDWRAAAGYVREHREPDEAIILISGHAYPVFAYYYGWEGWEALPDDDQLDITHVLDYPATVPRLNQTLAEASGAWLVLWQDEVVDPTKLVPALLDDVGRERAAPTLRGSSAGDQVELRHFELNQEVHFSDELPVRHKLEQTVAPGLAILGYDLPGEAIPADAEIPVRVFWQADGQLQGKHAASLRLSDRLGQEWARQDALLAGPYFSERWPVGKPVMGQYTVTLPLGTPPGTYDSSLMVYQGDATFETLSLSALVITRPQSMPSPPALGLPSPPAPSAAAAQDGQPALAGVGFDQQTVTPCQNWFLSLAWRASEKPTQDYSLRLTAGEEETETPLAVDYATTRWQPGDIWRTRHRIPVDCRALDGTIPIVAQLVGADGQLAGRAYNLGQVTVAAGREFTLPSDLSAVMDIQLADAGTLAGYRLDQDQVKPGENLRVTLYWRAGKETDQNYSVFVHLESDRVWAQHDGWPADGLKPTSTWAQNEVIADHHAVNIGTAVPPGSYRVVVGMYDPLTLAPLAAFEPDGQILESGRVSLQSITVLMP